MFEEWARLVFEEIPKYFLPQVAKLMAFLIIFISGIKVISLSGGIPRFDGEFVSKIKSLIIIFIGGIFLLLIVEPLLEYIFLLLLNKLILITIPIISILSGMAILQFDEEMKWDYSKYGYACIGIGILCIIYIFFYLS